MKNPLILTGCCLAPLFCLTCLGAFWIPETVFQLAGGWAFFLARVLPGVTVSLAGSVTAIVCLVALGVGIHCFCEWLYREICKRRGAAERGIWPLRWTSSILSVVVLMFIAGISVVGISHQTVWLMTAPEPLIGGGDAAARISTTNDLKQIGLAQLNFEETHKTLPAGCVVDSQGKLLHGWHAALLPYIEQMDLFRELDFGVPWDDARNRATFQKRITTYIARDRKRPPTNDRGQALTHYEGNAHVLGGDVPRLFKDITDGTANTLLAGEVNSEFKPWGYPANWRDPALGINRSPKASELLGAGPSRSSCSPMAARAV